MLDEKKTIECVAQFFTEHGRWPSAASSSGYESAAGIWLNQQRVADAAGTMDPFRRSFLDQNLPGWKACPEDIWQERAREVSDFVLCHGRLPDMNAAGKGEQLMAIWLSTQRALARSGCLEFTRRTWLNAHCPGWPGPTPNQSTGPTSPVFALKRRPS